MAMDRSYSLRCTVEGPQGSTSWLSPPDPTDKQTIDKGQVVAPSQALELVSGSSMHKWPLAR